MASDDSSLEDSEYEEEKALLAIGVSGACTGYELTSLTLENVEDIDRNLLLVIIPGTKTCVERSFTISEDFYAICKKFMNLRPNDCKCNHLILKYSNGKCSDQPVGINMIGTIPNKIASFLNLANPELYTGHCFRRTAVRLLVEAGGTMTDVKKLAGYPSAHAKIQHRRSSNN
ncbi:unnamed protein product [Trichogramma brassicae]|uniref:Tyr recombinase domain-containing protein n=1 Tax=Trichogramma brassicae TaxID=86971 RepID=A0A6H5IBB6_9HYME|nr:unnamed protein product [Trichogramma brassicae]